MPTSGASPLHEEPARLGVVPGVPDAAGAGAAAEARICPGDFDILKENDPSDGGLLPLRDESIWIQPPLLQYLQASRWLHATYVFRLISRMASSIPTRLYPPRPQNVPEDRTHTPNLQEKPTSADMYQRTIFEAELGTCAPPATNTP